MADTQLAPFDLTRTAFMVPLLRDGSIVLAHNCNRGLEIPGGHVEPGETLTVAAHRECVEETGYWVNIIKAIGYIRMESQGQVPSDWKYPHPLSYQQFFAGMVKDHVVYHVNGECYAPSVLSYDEALATLNPGRIALYLEARRVFGF